MDPDPSGTDAALVAGMRVVLIDENLVDQPFLDKYCVGSTKKRCRKARPLTHYKATFSARAMTARRKRRSGPHASPAFLRIASSSWLGNRLRETGLYLPGLGTAAPGERRADVPRHRHAAYSDWKRGHQRR
jgi:anaerobic selenocysteine-containing dehydrogenase